MEEAVGILEVYGLVCAFLAADAGCKAADVRLETFDKNKPANADALPVPLLVTVKFRGSVAAVEAAMEAFMARFVFRASLISSRGYVWVISFSMGSPILLALLRKSNVVA